MLARASLQKDSSFFPASSSTYIACESFRLSLYGDAISGYVYQYVEPDWFIAADEDESDENEATAAKTTEITRLRARKYDLRPKDSPGGQDKDLTVTFGAYLSGDGANFKETCDLGLVVEGFCAELNESRISKNSRIHIYRTPASNDYAEVELSEKPSLKLVGPGFGRQGLGVMRGKILNTSPHPSQSGAHITMENGRLTPKLFQIKFQVRISFLPDNFTLQDFGIYMSSGVRLYHENHKAGCVFDVMGPYMVVDLKSNDFPGDVLTYESGGAGNEIYLPNMRLYCNDDEDFDTSIFVNYVVVTDEAAGTTERRRAAMKSSGNWLAREGDYYVANLTVRPTDTALTTAFFEVLFGPTGNLYPEALFGTTGPESYKHAEWFVYTCTDLVVNNIQAPDVNVKFIEVNAGVNSPNLDMQTWGPFQDNGSNLDNAAPVHLVSRIQHRMRTEARSFKRGQHGLMCVNELFEMFNVPEMYGGGEKGIWTLQSASNGGFVIHINKDISRFQITKSFADLLGLEPYITVVLSEKKTDDLQLIQNLILVPYNKEREGMHQYNAEVFDDMVIEDSFLNYEYTVSALNPFPMDLEPSTTLANLIGVIVVSKVDGKLYKILNKVTVKHHETGKYKTRISAVTKMLAGTLIYEWPNVPSGSYIWNTGAISIESFSLFEGLTISVPNLPFDPQITTYSNGMRSICELRFPCPYNGGSDASGRVLQTSDEKIGDLIWSSSPSHQWLPVSSIGSIYSLAVQCHLVFRNANNRPPRPVHIPKNGIWQVKVILLEVK